MSTTSKWHPAEKQPCLTCHKWMHIDNPIFFLGYGYECHRCYFKRNSGKLKDFQPQQPKAEERICNNCGYPDWTTRHEVKTGENFKIPVKMHITADRKLICERCVTNVRLDRWWKNETAKPRQPHPSYYLRHSPLEKACGCDRCQWFREHGYELKPKLGWKKPN